MRIVLVTPYSWTTPGGVNAHIGGLAGRLRARGHEVRVLAPADGEVDAGIVPLGRTIGVPYNGSVARLAFGPRVAARVRVAMRRAHPDVVHVHEPFAPSASLLATIAARVPVVATFHASAEGRAYRVARVPLRPLWRKIAVKLAVSDAARETIEAAFGPGARVVPNGIDAARFAGVQADLHGKVVLFFGRLERRKGPAVLIEAIPELLRRVPGARVVFAGEGPLRRELEGALRDEHRAAVTFAGRFAEEERLRLFSSAAVACLPAVGGESFGITVLEAMAAGLPVVASSIPGYAAVARHGTDGLLVPPADAPALAEALARMLEDPEAARRMGSSGRARAARFDWSVVADEIEAAYREASAADARARPDGAR